MVRSRPGWVKRRHNFEEHVRASLEVAAPEICRFDKGRDLSQILIK